LITVMLVMLVLLGFGVAALWITSTNLQISGYANLRNQALYVAEAGIETVRADLNGPPSRVTTQLLAGGRDLTYDNLPTGTGVDGNGKPNGLGAVYFLANGTVLRDVVFPPASFGRGTGSVTPMSTTMGTYTVWIRNDTVELRQGKLTADDNGIVVVRVRGVAVDGRTEVVLEATLSSESAAGNPAELCQAGKNACEDNSSTLSGVFVK
jgi:hypothetical protein